MAVWVIRRGLYEEETLESGKISIGYGITSDLTSAQTIDDVRKLVQVDHPHEDRIPVPIVARDKTDQRPHAQRQHRHHKANEKRDASPSVPTQKEDSAPGITAAICIIFLRPLSIAGRRFTGTRRPSSRRTAAPGRPSSRGTSASRGQHLRPSTGGPPGIPARVRAPWRFPGTSSRQPG